MIAARLLLVLLAGAVAAAPALATPNGRGSGINIASAPAFRPDDLARFAGTNWPTVGGDYEQDRYSTLSQIDTGNVARLKAAWHVHLDGSATGTK